MSPDEAQSTDATVDAAPRADVSFGAGRYTVRSVLPEGGQKRAYVVHDAALDRPCVLSLIKAESLGTGELERLKREAQTMARVGAHPNIVTIFDFGEEQGRPYFVCEYVPGGDLRQEIRAAAGALAIDRALEVAEGVAGALAHAHALDIVHRDVKPANIWLDALGHAKLGDFGVAMTLDEARLTTTDGSMMGTAAYMAPEQALGQRVDERADLYALGVVIYEMVTGRPPFSGADALAVISQTINTQPIAPSWHNASVPRDLDRLVLMLLGKAPEDRTSTARDIADELRRVRDDLRTRPDAVEAAGTLPELQGIAWGRFVGRHRELAQLRTMLHEALAGKGAMASLVGEPGIGKTRLAEEFAVYARLRGALVLTGRCYEGEAALPYRPWVEAIEAYAASLADDELTRALGTCAADVATIVPDVARRLAPLPDRPPLDGDAERYRMFDGITSTLLAATASRPIVLMLDDLHWSDAPSLLLLQFLARRISNAPLMIVATYRDSEIDRSHTLPQILAELRRDASYQRLLLRGLPEDEVADLLEAVDDGGESSYGRGRLAAALFSETEGNPLFIREVLSHLVEEGKIYRDHGRWHSSVTDTLELGIPEGLRDVIARRLARLSPACSKMLVTASLMLGGFSWNELAAASRSPQAELIDLLEEALTAQLIFERKSDRTSAYDFTHGLIRNALSDELSTPRRILLHREIGEALETLYDANAEPHLAKLAHHFFQAAPMGDIDRGIAYARRAGDHAMGLLAYEDAAAQFGRALELFDLDPRPDEAARGTLLLALGEAHARAGDTPQMRETFAAAALNARTRGDAPALAHAALGFGRGEDDFVAEDRSLIDLLEEALAAVGPADARLRAMLLGRLATAVLTSADPSRAADLSAEAIEAAREAGDTDALVLALNARHEALTSPDALNERIRIADEATHAAAGIGDKVAAWYSHDWRLTDLLETGDIRAVDVELDHLGALADELRTPLWAALTVVARTTRALLAGRFADAERMIEETTRSARQMAAQALLFYSQWQLFWLRRQQGRIAETEDFVHTWVPDAANMGRYARIVAVREMELEHTDEARAAFERVAVDDFSALRFDNTWVHTFALVSEVCAYLDDAPRAEWLYARLLPFEGRNVIGGDIICLGAVAHYLALLARTAGFPDEAERHFANALEMNLRMSARPYVAQSQYEYARLLLARRASGDRDRAMDLLDQAGRIATDLGMRALLRRANTLRASDGLGFR